LREKESSREKLPPSKFPALGNRKLEDKGKAGPKQQKEGKEKKLGLRGKRTPPGTWTGN